MKPLFMLLTAAVIAIIIAASFGLQLMPFVPEWSLSDSVAAKALYVCPAADSVFDPIAKALVFGRNYLLIGFFILLLMTLFSFGWNFYQNLLKDEFNQKSYANSWFLLKILFWLTIVFTILLHAPNYYRTVKLKGSDVAYVLCEKDTAGALPVHSESVLSGD